MANGLSGWRRIAVVLSVLWELSVFGYIAFEYFSRLGVFFVDTWWAFDSSRQPAPSNLITVYWGRIFGALLVPGIVWAAGEIIVLAVLWIKDGFRARPDER